MLVIDDQVAELAQDYPCLTSLNSAELSPSSWLSVAWYFNFVPNFIYLFVCIRHVCLLPYKSIKLVGKKRNYVIILDYMSEKYLLLPF